MGKFKVLSGGGWFWIGVAGQRDPKRRTSALVGYKNALGFSVLDGWTSVRLGLLYGYGLVGFGSILYTNCGHVATAFAFTICIRM